MSEQKMYGIYSGCPNEGGACENVLYKTLESARYVALNKIKKRQQEDDECYSHLEPEFVPVEPWTETRENYWTNSIWCIAVQEFTVKENGITE